MTEKEVNQEHQELLQQHGVDKIRFYEKKTSLTDNVCTTCLFIDSKKKQIKARGVSICSLRDTFNRRDGKNRAFGRAIKALKRKINSKRIKGSARKGEIVDKLYKIRTNEDDNRFRNTVINELVSFDPDTNVTIIAGQGSKVIRKYLIQVPAHYPIFVANQLYRYKSEYSPNPACSEEYALLNG